MTVFWPMDFLVFLTYNVVLGERGANRSDHRPGEERETNRENVRGEGGKDLFFFPPSSVLFPSWHALWAFLGGVWWVGDCLMGSMWRPCRADYLCRPHAAAEAFWASVSSARSKKQNVFGMEKFNFQTNQAPTKLFSVSEHSELSARFEDCIKNALPPAHVCDWEPFWKKWGSSKTWNWRPWLLFQYYSPTLVPQQQQRNKWKNFIAYNLFFLWVLKIV